MKQRQLLYGECMFAGHRKLRIPVSQQSAAQHVWIEEKVGSLLSTLYADFPERYHAKEKLVVLVFK